MKRHAAVLLLATTASAAPAQRELPKECGDVARPEPGDAERAWNEHYKAGFEAIEAGDPRTAHDAVCQALADSVGFGARDWRFAETLDELGYADYLLGDVPGSTVAQARAVGEALLALGPGA